jgi:hypothetical protein
MIALAEKTNQGLPTFSSASDDGSSAGEKLENQSDDSQYEQDVDKPAQGIAAHDSD